MSASSKFDLSSSSPDRPLYTSGHRGSYTAASLDRSGSFRENMESPVLPSLPNITKGSSAATQGDVAGFLRCLRFDPKSMVSDHKLNRPVDFKRLASLSLGVPLEDSSSVPSKGKPLSSPSHEDFRRLKSALRESCSNARQRVKIFTESLSGMNKLFPTIPSRKRSRSDALSNDRSNSLYSVDRSVAGAGITKMGAQNQVSISGFEVETKSEERAKSAPNKRTRTSMMDPRMDARANTPARPPGVADRDREVLKIPGSNVVQSEERALPIGVDGWEKSKMKKKRSGIKSDIATESAAAKPNDSSRDSKQGMQQRVFADPRSRLNDNHGFRPGIASGSVAKVDGASQQMGSGIRASIGRAEQDSGSLLQEKRDRPTEKERVNLKAINKTSAREDLSSGSPTSSTKLNASARAPRSGPSVGPKMSPVVSRATSMNDWELSHCTSKLPAAVGASSRKRTPSMRSSSPPVPQWASHRPQKISRTARRTNFVPIVQNNDESSALDTTCIVGNERRLSGSSPQQIKLKSDPFSSATLSESEESGPADMKSKEKTKKSDDIDEKATQNVQKMSNLMLPPRKNKIINGEDPGDGVRRQGRTSRGFTSTRSLMPLAMEKLGNVGTAKQLRSARLGFDKTESKTGRPLTRKLSDRKAYTRQKYTVVNAAADFLDDGHEELLAAANAVINPAQALSSSFWKQMEPFFCFISDVDLAFLKQQVNLESTVASPAPVPSGLESDNLVVNGFGFNVLEREGIKAKCFEHSHVHIAPGKRTLDEVPLYQRLISALIPEEDEELCFSGNEDLCFDVCTSGFELDTDVKSDSLQPQMLQNSEISGYHVSNGYRIKANGRSFNELESTMPDGNIMQFPDGGAMPSYDNSENGLLTEKALIPGINCTEFQYNNMSLNERLLLEIHCIGIFPEVLPDSAHSGDGELAGEIINLHEKYHQQVSKRKGLLGRLLKSASGKRDLQEKEFEQHALDKLVGMAYEKYMACRGPNAHGMKSASGKMARQAALAFVKRTLKRCQEFEDTGKSCFNEPMYRDIFLAGTCRLGEGRTIDYIADGESGKRTSSGLDEVRASAHLGGQKSPLTNHEIYSSETPLSANLTSELTTGKEESWSSRVKKKELLLDDVGAGTIGTSSGAGSGIGSSFSSSAKGKRSERDRDGKGSTREALSRSGITKIGRPTSANVKGERKTKTKPKQKTTQLSASVNGLLGKMSEKPKGTLPSLPKSSDTSSSGITKDKIDYGLEELEDPIDLSGLQLPEMDVLGVPDDLGGQGQDIGSWLNIDDDGLQDHDFMGLEIPMDDLSDLNMLV